MMDLKINGLVKHDGKQYKPGDELKRIKKEDGDRLVDLGVATEITKESKNDKE